MKIVDMHANPVKGCCQFEYKGMTISVSTVFKPHSVAVLDAGGAFVGSDHVNVESALQFVDGLVPE